MNLTLENTILCIYERREKKIWLKCTTFSTHFGIKEIQNIYLIWQSIAASLTQPFKCCIFYIGNSHRHKTKFENVFVFVGIIRHDIYMNAFRAIKRIASNRIKSNSIWEPNKIGFWMLKTSFFKRHKHKYIHMMSTGTGWQRLGRWI